MTRDEFNDLWERIDRSRAERGSFVEVSQADRIALARELLVGTPWADALDDAAQALVDARAAMLADPDA